MKKKENVSNFSRQKILLALLPFWTPLIPPQGIASLKSYLREYGYKIKTVDATVEEPFMEIYHRYFNRLKTLIPENHRGNFYNIGHDVLQNHMMAHMHHQNEQQKEYMELVKIIIYKIFYISITDTQVLELDNILDEFYSRLKHYIIHLLRQEKPGVFGLTVHNHTLPASLYAFKLCKETYPRVQTVMGGGIFTESLAIGSKNLEYFLERTPYIDKLVIGAGEKLFLGLLQGTLAASQRVYTLEDIDNETIDLSSADIPDISDFNLDVYPYQAAAGSTSCPFQCSFCSEPVFYGKYKKKNVKQIVKEMLKMYRNHRNQLFNMTDSLLNPIITDLANEFIDSGVSLYWDGYLRVSSSACDIENTLLWRRGGFYRAMLGLESGSRRVLDLMGKKITPQQSKAALASIADAGIKTTTYWVIGHPGETEADFLQTLAFLEETKDDIYEAESHPFQYYPSGLVKSKHWTKNSITLYPEEAKEMLILQTYIVDADPPRQEIYRRLNRFVQHCKRLGIPNPYSLNEIYEADERWKKLHKNAVPSIMKFKDKASYLDESRNIGNLYPTGKTIPEAGDFLF